MFKNRNLLYPILLLILASISCKKEPIQEEKKVIPPTNALRIAVIPTSDCLPFLVAVHAGIADSLGLSLHVETFGSSMDADTAFQFRHVDGIVTDMVKAGIMESNGDSVSVVMGGDWHLSLVVSKQSRVSDLSGLKDRIISITRNSVTDMFFDKLLKEAKLESIDANKPQINNLQIRYQMLVQNQYDGAILPEPWASMSVFNGCTSLASYDDIPGMDKTLCLMFRDSVIDTRSKDIQKLITAYNKSVDYINHYSWLKTDEFLRLLGVKQLYPFIVFGKSFSHATLPSEAALSTGKSWSTGRDLLGRKSKENIIHNEFIH